MSGTFAFLGGALNRRQDVINQELEDLRERERYMKQTFQQMQPLIAQQREKANEWNNRARAAKDAGLSDAQINYYASNSSLGEDFLIRYMNSKDITNQTKAAMDQSRIKTTDTTAAPLPQLATDPVVDTTQPVTPTIDPVGGGIKSPADFKGQFQPFSKDMLNPLDPTARVSFTDVLFGRIPEKVAVNTLFQRLGADTGQDPASLQQQFAAYLTGDYIFNPNTAAQGMGLDTSQPLDLKRDFTSYGTKVADIMNTLEFESPEVASQAAELLNRAFAESNPELMQQAYGLAMDAKSAAELRAGAVTGAFNNNQITNQVDKTLGSLMGAQFTIDPTTGSVTSFNWGQDEAGKAAIFVQAKDAANKWLEEKTGGDWKKVKPSDISTASALALKVVSELYSGAAPISDQVRKQYNNLGFMGVTVEDENKIRRALGAPDRKSYEEYSKMVDDAIAAGDTDTIKELMSNYPDLYEKKRAEMTKPDSKKPLIIPPSDSSKNAKIPKELRNDLEDPRR